MFGRCSYLTKKPIKYILQKEKNIERPRFIFDKTLFSFSYRTSGIVNVQFNFNFRKLEIVFENQRIKNYYKNEHRLFSKYLVYKMATLITL